MFQKYLSTEQVKGNKMIKSFIRSRKGTAGIEFALGLPVLLLVIFGSVDLYDYMAAKNKSIRTADLVSDLIARSSQMGEDEARVMYDAAILSLQHYANDTEVKVSMVGWVYDEDEDEFFVRWSKGLQSQGNNISDPTSFNVYPDDHAQDASSLNFPQVMHGQMLVFADIEFEYKNKVYNSITNQNINFKSSGLRRPRFVNSLAWVE